MNNLVISDCLYGLVLARGRWIMHESITNIKVQGYINPSSFVTYRFGFNFKCCLVTQSCPTLCDPMDAAHQASLSFTASQSLLKLMSIESVMPSNQLILLLSIFPSIRVFSKESALCIRWPKYWSFRISSSSEYSGLISFKIDYQAKKGK